MKPGFLHVVCFTALAGGCSEPGPAALPGVLTISQEQHAAWVRNFNPLLAEGMARWPTLGAMYEPMLIFNSVRGEYVPWLATGYAWSDDALTLTFTLRDGVVWSDGEAFTAQDVAFTFSLLRIHRALDQQGVWGVLTAVSEVNPHTVVFSFARPYVPGLFFVGHQAIVPEHVWRDVDDPVMFANEDPVATGPFTEVEVFQTQVYQVGRNPRYWQPGKPAVRSLRLPAYPGNDQANLALLNDEVDWASTFVPAIDRIYVGTDPDHHGYWYPTVGGTVMLYTNLTRVPFADERVRKALSLAIDRELIVKVAMYGYTRPADATGLCDRYQGWQDAAAVAGGDWVAYDPAAANRLLDEAGYARGPDGTRRLPDGTAMRYQISVAVGWSDWTRASQIIARGFSRVGIRVSLKTYDYPAWFDRLQRGEFDLSLGWTLDGPTPYHFYRGLMSAATVQPVGRAAASNWQRYASSRADEILRAFEATQDRAGQMRLAGELQREFVAHAPAIPLFPAPAWGAYNTRRFSGFPTADNSYALLAPRPPESLLVVTELRPR
jgi:peptide/nickel transport system substrate-binding protein